jgi:hypothetical protein
MIVGIAGAHSDVSDLSGGHGLIRDAWAILHVAICKRDVGATRVLLFRDGKHYIWRASATVDTQGLIPLSV